MGEAMKEFKSFKAFNTHIKKVVTQYERREKSLLDITGRFLEKESKAIIGHLQAGYGEFKAWPELADSTKEEKEKLGYGDASNDWQPLLRTGEMRDSISYATELHKVYIGSTSDIMVYQEMGTGRIPARPVLGLAIYREKRKVQLAIGNFMYSWITDTRAQGKIS